MKYLCSVANNIGLASESIATPSGTGQKEVSRTLSHNQKSSLSGDKNQDLVVLSAHRTVNKK
jgi:sortase (surface protein transpeptidase)